MPIAIIIAILIAGGAGVSFVADGALPGDSLYPIKVNINEEVRSAFALSAETQAEIEISRADRRIAEAEELAAEGRFDQNAKASVEEQFTAHVEAFERQLVRLEEREDLEAAAEITGHFEAMLRAHERILARLADRVEGELEDRVDNLLVMIRARLDAAVDERERAEARVTASAQADVEAAAQGSLRATVNKIAEVRSFIDRRLSRVHADISARAETRLAAAERLVADGRASLEAGAFGDAFVIFQEAHRIAQDAKLIMNAGLEGLHVDIIISGGTEDDMDDEDEDEDSEDEDDSDVEADVEVETRGNVNGTNAQGSGDVEVRFGY